MIRAVRTLTVKDVRLRLRDKSFLLLGILTPLVLAFVLDLVFGGVEEDGLEIRLGVADADESAISAEFGAHLLELDGQGSIHVTSVAAAGADAALGEQELDAVLVIPAGFAEQLQGGTAAPELVLVENPDRPVQASVAASIADGLTADLERNRLLAAASGQLNVTPDLDAATSDVEVSREFPSGEGLGAGARMLAGMAIMFVFFTVQFGVTTLLEEKQAGTMTRLLAAPIPRDSIVVSKGLVGFVLGTIATLILLGAGTVLIGAEWGSWLGVVPLVLAAVLTAVALMAIVAALAKTAEGAGGVQAMIAVTLAMIGGSWFPVSGEGAMGVVARLTPHFWFLGGLEDLAGGASWTSMVQPVAMLAIIAVAAGVPAFILLRRRLTA